MPLDQLAHHLRNLGLLLRRDDHGVVLREPERDPLHRRLVVRAGEEADEDGQPVGVPQRLRAGDDTFAEEENPVADLLDLSELVRIEKNERAAPFLFGDEIAHQENAAGIEAGGRLVEEHVVGLVDQRLTERDALEHAPRVLAEAAVLRLGQSEAIEHRHGPALDFGRGDAGEAGHVAEELPAGFATADVHPLGDESDAPAHVEVVVAQAGERDLAVVGTEESEEAGHERGLAGAIGTDEADDLSPRDLEIDAGQHCLPAEALPDAARCELCHAAKEKRRFGSGVRETRMVVPSGLEPLTSTVSR